MNHASQAKKSSAKDKLSAFFAPKTGGKEKSPHLSVASPMTGEVIPLENTKDPAFAFLGKGVAIIPSEGAVYSPVDGIAQAVFHTNHALGLKAENGVEILIHVGMDTVKLEGRHFTAHVSQGGAVKTGQLLIEFDMDEITVEGYSLETPVVITNHQNFKSISVTDKKAIKSGEELMTVG